MDSKKLNRKKVKKTRFRSKMIRALVNNEGKISTPTMMEFKEALTKYTNQEVEIDIRKRKRTSPQNRTFHWGLRIFADGLTDLGYRITMLDLKYELKQRGFFGWVEYETKDGIQKRPKDTSEMNVDECSRAFKDIQMAAGHYEIIVPDPDQKDFL